MLIPQADENTISSHGNVIDNSQEYIAPSGPAPDESKAAPTQDESKAAPAQDESKAAPVQGEGAPAPAQGEGGGNSSLIQQMADQLAGLTAQLSAQPQGAENAPVDPTVEIDNALQTLQAQARDGEITYDEMVMQTAPLIEQKATLNVTRQLQQQAQAKQIEDAQGSFLAENPDFVPFAQSPEAQAMIQSNPLLDNVSAYYAYKAKMYQDQLEQSRAQIQNSIKGAASSQSQIVGAETGDNIGVPKLYRGDGMTAQAGGVAALQRARKQL